VILRDDIEYEKKAELLLPTIRLTAIYSHSTLCEKIPLLEHVQLKDWEFFYSIASTFIATIGMERAKLDNDLKSKLSKNYGTALLETFSEWAIAFKDCSEFFWKNVEILQSSNDSRYIQSPELTISDTIGFWLTINIMGHWPESEEEGKLVTLVGGLICSEFIDWWKD
jgi:hypothetical protein